MSNQSYNPILPLYEYIPDGEPHVFGDRVYLFGSHDMEGGLRYCAMENYVAWSAPVSDPGDWRCEGEIYSSRQDPDYDPDCHNDLYAPDVVQGNDGRYYLYYNFVSSASGASGHDKISVAVSDTPGGRYEYLGYVRNADGSVYNRYLMGDPAVINDDGVIRLYAGWSLSMVAAGAHQQGKGHEGENRPNDAQAHASVASRAQQAPMLPQPGDPQMNIKLAFVYKMLFKRTLEQVQDLEYPLMGANTYELEDDMLTVKAGPYRIVPGQFDTPADSSYYGHAFYEASSIRKINGLYYFIYSSENSNELCYATSRYPDREFTYGGTIISNGDVGYQGRKPEERLNMTANDHGSLEQVGGQWYIFHHRQTHRSTFSRQACAERVTILPDGSIPQVECTSMGFNPGPLKPIGTFPAPICCVLTNGAMPHCTNTMLDTPIPHITNSGEERYIACIQNGTRIGYKYYEFAGDTRLTLCLRGNGNGSFRISAGGETLATIPVTPADHWTECSGGFSATGVLPLYLDYEGEGQVELLTFELSSR